MIHQVFIDRVGGGMVLTCESLQLKCVEYPYKELNEEGIIKTITHFKSLGKKQAEDLEVEVTDRRSPEENFNEQRKRESRSQRPL